MNTTQNTVLKIFSFCVFSFRGLRRRSSRVPKCEKEVRRREVRQLFRVTMVPKTLKFLL